MNMRDYGLEQLISKFEHNCGSFVRENVSKFGLDILHPAKKLREGTVFTSICFSIGGW